MAWRSNVTLGSRMRFSSLSIYTWIESTKNTRVPVIQHSVRRESGHNSKKKEKREKRKRERERQNIIVLLNVLHFVFVRWKKNEQILNVVWPWLDYYYVLEDKRNTIGMACDKLMTAIIINKKHGEKYKTMHLWWMGEEMNRIGWVWVQKYLVKLWCLAMQLWTMENSNTHIDLYVQLLQQSTLRRIGPRPVRCTSHTPFLYTQFNCKQVSSVCGLNRWWGKREHTHINNYLSLEAHNSRKT